MVSSSGDQQQHSLSKSVSLSRSVVLTQDTSIPSMLILGKLLTVSDSDGTTTMASLRAMLLQDWAPSGAVNFWRVTDGAFLVQFHEEADLRRAMDGAPWSCDGGRHLFLMQQAKPETNLVDQLVTGTGFATANLWVQFHNVPVEYFSEATLSALAASVGVPLVLPDLGAAPVELLRARIRVDITRPLVRSLQVDLDDDGRRELVSVVYEQIPILSCGIVGDPVDRCPNGAAAAAAASSRSRREKPAAPSSSTWSLRGSRRSSTMKEAHPPDAEKNDHSGWSSGGGGAGSTASSLPPDDACQATSSRSRRENKSTVYVPSRLGSTTELSGEQQPLLGTVEKDEEDPPAPSSRTSSSTGGGERLQVLGTPERHTAVSVNRCLPFNSILKLVSRTKKKEPVGEIKAADGGGVNLQGAQRTSQKQVKQQTLLLTFSAQQNVQVWNILSTV